MPAAVGIRAVGNNLIEFYDDGSSRIFAPTAGGIYLPTTGSGTSTGAGGEGPSVPATGGTPGSVAAPTDDYPWPKAPQNDMSPLRYSYRDCTDFAAWRINRDLGRVKAPWMYDWGTLRIVNGNAIGWKADWLTHGWSVSASAHAGWLGWYGAKAGSQGHVNYVQAVGSDGTVHLEEYNWGAAHRQAYNQRDAAPSDPYYPDAFLAMPPAR